VILALLPVIRAPGPLPPPQLSNELVVMVRPGPAFYFTGPDGALAGLEVDLARRFAAENKLPLRFMLADSAAQVLAGVANEEAHIGAGGLYRPLSLPRTPAPIAAAEAGTASTGPTVPDVKWTAQVASSEPVLIYNSDG
jgi:hypothetical protein